MDTFVELRATITDFQAKMAVARGEMEKTSKAGSSNFAALSKGIQVAGAAIAAGAVAVGVLSVKAASSAEDAHVKLAQAIRDTGGNMVALTPRINAVDASMTKFGYSNTQVQEALAVGTTGLGSTSKAMSILMTAANLAAYKHIDLSTAMLAVTKAMEGNQRPLHQIGVDLPIVASSAAKVAAAQAALTKAQAGVNTVLAAFPNAADAASKGHAKYETAIGKVSAAQQKLSALQVAGGQIIDALNKRMGGQAAAAADTMAGKLKAAQATAENLEVALGNRS